MTRDGHFTNTTDDSWQFSYRYRLRQPALAPEQKRRPLGGRQAVAFCCVLKGFHHDATHHCTLRPAPSG